MPNFGLTCILVLKLLMIDLGGTFFLRCVYIEKHVSVQGASPPEPHAERLARFACFEDFTIFYSGGTQQQIARGHPKLKLRY